MGLADGCQTDDLVHARDDANIFLEDDKGNIHEAISKSALYIPSYRHFFTTISDCKWGFSLNQK